MKSKILQFLRMSDRAERVFIRSFEQSRRQLQVIGLIVGTDRFPQQQKWPRSRQKLAQIWTIFPSNDFPSNRHDPEVVAHQGWSSLTTNEKHASTKKL